MLALLTRFTDESGLRVGRAAVGIALVLALTVSSAGAEERSSPRDVTDQVSNAALPGRDPVDLAVRLRGIAAAATHSVPFQPAPLVTGYMDTFWILDQRTAQLFQAGATLRLVTPHAYWFVQTGLGDRAPQTDLERSASTFESQTYPLIRRYFGSEPSPGVDGDPHIVFLLGDVPGVAAYFSSADAYPRTVNPRSNEHEMIYVNVNSLRPGQTTFDSTVAHEFQHMVHFARCPNQEGWVDEGASELAMRVAGYDGPQPAAFAARPDVQLTGWTSQQADLARHYQAAYLFLRYVAERAGGWDALPRIFETCARGEDLFRAFLQREPIDPDLDALFTDWTVANVLQDSAVADGRFAYAGGSFRASVTGAVVRQRPFLGSVPQYAANYVDLPPGPGMAAFSGDASVAAFSAPIDDGGAWWSNRGDSLDSRLARELDLSGVASATLQFRVWYDLEDQFDFVYLAGSGDGGQTWQVLPGGLARSDNATGNNYGSGWTSSSNGWVDEEVDLSQFAGGPALLRFEYVTDQSYNRQGFAFKDVRVPEIGLDERGAPRSGWTSEGWVRVDALLEEHWNLRLVRWTPNGVFVDAVPVAADGSATFELDPLAARSTLVIAPTAPRTLVPANYSLVVRP